MEGKTCLIVITGASRGIGKELALQLSKLVGGAGSVFMLMARNEAALVEVKEIMLRNNSELRVELISADFSEPTTNNLIGEKIRALEKDGDYEQRLIVHNAGTVGDMTKKSSELSDESQWHTYLQTNLVSTISLNNQIFAALRKEQVTIVNITSLLSIKPFASFTQYSVGKAAREAYFRAFAAEHSHCRVLSYSPGPVDTDMHAEVRDKTYDKGVQALFSKCHEGGSNMIRKLLTTVDTVSKFIDILQRNKFESGDRVDYFDD